MNHDKHISLDSTEQVVDNVKQCADLSVMVEGYCKVMVTEIMNLTHLRASAGKNIRMCRDRVNGNPSYHKPSQNIYIYIVCILNTFI